MSDGGELRARAAAFAAETAAGGLHVACLGRDKGLHGEAGVESRELGPGTSFG